MTTLSPAPAPGALIKDSTDRAFAADVIQESMNQPVIVDFWAPWCGPCRQLGPAIERQVEAARGAVKLVKINIDENPQIAGRLRVQSIPAVYAFRNGQPVDGFVGALPESQIKQFVARLAQMAGGVDEIAAVIEEANALLEAGHTAEAGEAFAAVLEAAPDRPEAIAGLARCHMANGNNDGALDLISNAPDEAKAHEAVKAVRAALDLAAKAAQGAGSAALQAKADAHPGDHQARYDLAVALAAEGRQEEAIDHLLLIVRAERDWDEQKARKELLTLFEALGPADPRVAAGRRKLSAILFS